MSQKQYIYITNIIKSAKHINHKVGNNIIKATGTSSQNSQFVGITKFI